MLKICERKTNTWKKRTIQPVDILKELETMQYS